MSAPFLQGAPVPLWDVLAAFFSWRDSAVALVAGATNWRQLVIWIVALSGLSEAIGQSVVLFANQVRPARFLLSLIVTALLHLIGFFIWVGSFWFVIFLVLDAPIPMKPLLIVVGVSYVPILFGFLGFLPYAGQPILQLLYAWSYGIMVYYLQLAEQITFYQALLVGGIGLLAILLLRASVGRPLETLASRVLDVTAGTKLTFDVDEAVARLASARSRQGGDAA